MRGSWDVAIKMWKWRDIYINVRRIVLDDIQRGTVIVTNQNYLGSSHNHDPVMHYSVMQKKPIFAFKSLNKQNTLYQWLAVMFKPMVSGSSSTKTNIGAFRPEKLIFWIFELFTEQCQLAMFPDLVKRPKTIDNR